MSTALELMKKAYDDETIFVVIDMNGVKGTIDYAASLEMYIKQSEYKLVKRLEYNKQGFAKQPIDEQIWKDDLERARPEHKERIEKTKPKNAAEQLTDVATQFMVVRDLVPQFIRYADGAEKGELMFPDAKSQEQAGQFIMNHRDLMQTIISGLTELYRRIDEVAASVKNSPKPESFRK